MSVRPLARPRASVRSRRARSAVTLAAFLVLTAVIAAVEGVAATSSAGAWFDRSAQVFWTAPRWFSHTAWAAVFLILAVAGWRIWRRTGTSLPRVLYAVALVLLTVWPLVYLDGYPLVGLPALWCAFFLAFLLVGSVILLVAALWRPARTAAVLLLPVAAWLLYVASINLGDAVLAALG